MKKHWEVILSYNDKLSSFQKLLEKYNIVTIHRNIKILATKTYKFLQGFSPRLMNEIFVKRNNNYSLRGNNVLTRRRVNSVRYGTDSSKNMGHFAKGEKWIPLELHYRLCKTYVQQVGIIWVVRMKNINHISFTNIIY